MIVSKAVHTDSQLSTERFAKAAYTECVHRSRRSAPITFTYIRYMTLRLDLKSYPQMSRPTTRGAFAGEIRETSPADWTGSEPRSSPDSLASARWLTRLFGLARKKDCASPQKPAQRL
jgi:hypothetical protein